MVQNMFILVHGTFARTARWVATDSGLAQMASSTLPAAEVRSFLWSGKNNHQARVDAGRDLALFITDLCVRYPFAALHLIGHSHGGNVILYALNQHPHADRITTTSFLGTPFLVPLNHNVKSRFEFVEFILPIGVAILAVLATAVSFGVLLEISPAISEDPIIFFLGWILSMPLTLWLGYDLGGKMSRRVQRQVEKRQRLWTSTIVAPAPPCRAFIAASGHDEAAAWLGSFDQIVFLPFFILSSMRKFLGGAALALILMFAMLLPFGIAAAFLEAADYDLSVFKAAYPSILASGAAAAIIAAMFILAAAIIQTVLASLIRGAPLVFGGESPLLVLALRVMPKRVPNATLPPGSHIQYFDFPFRWLSLRHSAFYDDKNVLAALRHWLASPAEDKAMPPPGKGKSNRRQARWTFLHTAGFWSTLGMALAGISIALFNPILFGDIHAYLGLDVPEGSSR